MTNEQDLDFIRRIDQALADNGSLVKATEALKENYDQVYARIRRLGYKIVGHLVPVHSAPVDSMRTDSQQDTA